MEDKPKSFYEFLTSNAKKQPIQEEKADGKKNVGVKFKVLAWIVIFICNSLLVYMCWNFALTEIFKIAEISFIQSIAVYTLFKILTRGMFTIQ